MKDIQALKKEYEDKEWEKFKEKILIQENQDIPSHDNSMFDDEKFNDIEEQELEQELD